MPATYHPPYVLSVSGVVAMNSLLGSMRNFAGYEILPLMREGSLSPYGIDVPGARQSGG
ncbi:hypothetical protein DES53_112130 [Roseimicrobium gellanilyticum]|uniref:Uncharacterized protein n=1 Tax=Roseimicrobium gellanilyticum TaxID=748857 RepID=A0A366H7I5_9BACT|nr:hypothetical protein [Roseimicrobium gellanilyticum]RBP38132.1 hypothetical protein DES53_112130 [Roseimicrobium gellanilyticum]